MNVLFTVWELDPFFKMGGLGDVARSLPGALKKLGIDIRIILPYYSVVKMGKAKKTLQTTIDVPYAGKMEHIEIWETTHPNTNVPVYLLKNSTYFDTAVSMDTWGFFDIAVVTILKKNALQWMPDIIHTNDLHCGFIPLLSKKGQLPVKTVLTIHNLSYQGKTSVDILKKMDIAPEFCKALLWEIKNSQINFLLEGIMHADIITTVSPTYAKEILTEELGCGLNEVLRGREGRVFGILNGIDTEWREIMHIRHVKHPYGTTQNNNDWQEAKKRNKRFLQKKLGLKVRDDIPLISFIGRFDGAQKGLDILHTMLRRINITKFQFVILGSGEKNWEERFQWLSTFYPKSISCSFTFNETLANQMYAAADFLVIPSRFEPCGLIQMIAMSFGTLPIAHRTGGLRDSIKDGYNGFLFNAYNSEALEGALERAVTVWKEEKKNYATMVDHAFTTDFSWDKSAKHYQELYEKLLTDIF